MSSTAPSAIPDHCVVDHVFAVPRPPDRPAIVDAATGDTLTYGELADRIDRVAGALQQRGLGTGDVVAIFGLNSGQFAVALYASLRTGATATLVNSLYTEPEVRAQLEHSRACLVFADAACLPRVPAGTPVIGLDVPAGPGGETLRSLAERGHRARAVRIDPAADVALLPYSSGTTGTSKAVMLTHRNLVANMCQNDAFMTDLTDGSRVLASPPFFHIYGTQIVLNLSLRAGALVVTLPRFEFRAFLDAITRYRTDRVYASPPVLVLLAKSPLEGDADLGAVRYLFSGAAPLDEALAGTVAARLGCRIRQGYGMTELGPTSHATPDHRDDLPVGSVGLPAPYTDWRVVDPGTGRDAGPGRTGELWCRGPNVMRGYLRDPEATAATIDADGFLHTGDLVRHDADGVLTVVGRLKELIKYKGHQVPPAELEAVLMQHPGIADAAVAGRPDELAGEIPVAFVVRRPGGDGPTAEAVLDFVAVRVAPHKKVRAVRFVERIPKSGSGKILRRLLPV
ncbi:AMP-binding protein [Amycolatopsis sp. NPDC051716]|uniref:AMP-binding protein n=1 Tax=Amycolatopsis sp. NPDC051716 TaxID=3155804 RepID=UPI003424C6A5